MWFGTNGDGVIRYNGDTLEYFTDHRGFTGVAVRGIVEDADGNVWFGTERGLNKFNGTSFTNYNSQDGLPHDDVWSLMIDRDGLIWVGTYGGACTFDGRHFTAFELPPCDPDPMRGVSSGQMVQSIMQDRKGRMWFSNNGGAYMHDGETLTHLTVADGLCHNSVNSILEDREGNFWFATHHNGICRWDGKSFTHITKEADGVEGLEAWSLYMDRVGNVWFPTEHYGVYRYDGSTFTNVHHAEGLSSNAIQCTFEDKDGRIWFGGHTGLFCYDGKSVFAVGKHGPWPES